MDGNRRAARRIKAWFPVRMRMAGDRNTAVAQDVSETGILLATRKRLEPGSTIHVCLHVDPESGSPRLVHGRVVRQEPNRNDPGGLWPYKAAIEFTQPDPSLISEISAA